MVAIVDVERLTRYVRDLHALLTNTVAFTDFYARKKAVFQAGTLFLDGRACDLCLNVLDAGRHAAQAPAKEKAPKADSGEAADKKAAKKAAPAKAAKKTTGAKRGG
jgi:hypothetical protein